MAKLCEECGDYTKVTSTWNSKDHIKRLRMCKSCDNVDHTIEISQAYFDELLGCQTSLIKVFVQLRTMLSGS